MAKRNRRQTVIATATLALGAAGFVNSGALTAGSQGILDDNWIQVAGAGQPVTFSSLRQTGEEDSSSGEATESGGTTDGDAGGDDGATGDETDGTDGTDDRTSDGTPASTSVEVLVDSVAANGLNSTEPAIWDGSLFETATLLGRLINTCVEPVMLN